MQIERKHKVFIVLSIIFTILSIAGFLLCLFILFDFFVELNKPTPECESLMCINLQGSGMVIVAYLLIIPFVLLTNILSLVFSILNRKQYKVARLFIILESFMIFIELAILVLMILINN